MRKIETIREHFFRDVGDGKAVVVRISDWRKIMRVLRAADEWNKDSSHATVSELLLAIDALNKEPKK